MRTRWSGLCVAVVVCQCVMRVVAAAVVIVCGLCECFCVGHLGGSPQKIRDRWFLFFVGVKSGFRRGGGIVCLPRVSVVVVVCRHAASTTAANVVCLCIACLCAGRSGGSFRRVSDR